MAHRCVVPRFLWRPQLLTRFQGLSAAKVSSYFTFFSLRIHQRYKTRLHKSCGRGTLGQNPLDPPVPTSGVGRRSVGERAKRANGLGGLVRKPPGEYLDDSACQE